MRIIPLLLCLLVASAGCIGASNDDPLIETEPTEAPSGNVTVMAPELVVAANIHNGTAPLNVTLDIDVLHVTNKTVAWHVTSNGTTLAEGTTVPAQAVVTLDAGLHTLLVRAAGLQQAIDVNVTGPTASFTIADITASPGMRIPLSSGVAEGCTWDIPDALEIGDGGACDTWVRFTSIGSFPATVTAAGMERAISITTVFPETDDDVSGSLFMYNNGGVGASNVVALGIGEYHYVTGDTVSTQGRSMTGDLEGIADGTEYFFLDAAGNVVLGPLNAGNGQGGDWASQSVPITSSTFPADGGRYYLGAVAYMEDGPIWIQETSDARNGFKGFIVHHLA